MRWAIGHCTYSSWSSSIFSSAVVFSANDRVCGAESLALGKATCAARLEIPTIGSGLADCTNLVTPNRSMLMVSLNVLDPEAA